MTLDHFEQSLLTDLRHEVALRGTAPAPKRSRRWRWAAVPAGVAAATVAIVVSLLQPSAAFAVSESHGDVVVTISRLDDSAGLEKALAEHNIKADVDYSATPPALPANGGGTVTQKNDASGPHETGPSLDSAGGPAGPGSGPAGPQIQSSLKGDEFTMRIDPDSIPKGAVLHITTSGSGSSGLSGLQVLVTQG